MRLLAFALTAIAMAMQMPALASTIVVPTGDTLSLAIDPLVGSVLQLPASVRTITPVRGFAISDLGGEVDKATGQKIDVRTFQVRATGTGEAEAVTFLLASGKNIKLRLHASPQAERFYDLQFLADSMRMKDAKFLSNEVALLKAMVRDDSDAFPRQVVNDGVAIAGAEDLKVKLTHVYSTLGITGYVFSVANRAKNTVLLNASGLVIGSPNRVTLAQLDNPSLPSCKTASTSECTTTLRLVVQGAREVKPSLSASSGSVPFMKEASQPGGEE